MVTAVIIDDEKGARETLKNMLRVYCQDVELVGEAESIDVALPLIWKETPNIIFLDIEMPKGSGFDLADKLKETDSKIIFTTAYSKYALRAIKASAFDYLLKPIEITELKESIAKTQTKINESKSKILDKQNNLASSNNDNGKNKLAIPSSDGYDIINTDDIIFCEANRNYTTFYLVSKLIVVASKTLKEYEKLLPEKTFIRVHQKYLVNFNYVVKYIRGRGGFIIMSNGIQVPISQGKKAQLNKLLSNFLK